MARTVHQRLRELSRSAEAGNQTASAADEIPWEPWGPTPCVSSKERVLDGQPASHAPSAASPTDCSRLSARPVLRPKPPPAAHSPHWVFSSSASKVILSRVCWKWRVTQCAVMEDGGVVKRRAAKPQTEARRNTELTPVLYSAPRSPDFAAYETLLVPRPHPRSAAPKLWVWP